MMAHAEDETRLPIQFFATNGDVFFASWDWTRFFKIRETFKVEEISSQSYVLNADNHSELGMAKGFFNNEIEYTYNLLVRILYGSVDPSADFLFPDIDLKHIRLWNVESYDDLNLAEKRMGGREWQQYDYETFKAIHNSLITIGLDTTIYHGIQHINETKQYDYIVIEISLHQDIIGALTIQKIDQCEE